MRSLSGDQRGIRSHQGPSVRARISLPSEETSRKLAKRALAVRSFQLSVYTTRWPSGLMRGSPAARQFHQSSAATGCRAAQAPAVNSKKIKPILVKKGSGPFQFLTPCRLPAGRSEKAGMYTLDRYELITEFMVICRLKARIIRWNFRGSNEDSTNSIRQALLWAAYIAGKKSARSGNSGTVNSAALSTANGMERDWGEHWTNWLYRNPRLRAWRDF